MKRRRSYLKRVTLEKRILLLLMKNNRFRENYMVPEILSQGGMANDMGTRQNHVSRAIIDLESKDLIDHRSAHVDGKKRKRKVYFLNERGMEETRRYIRELGEKLLTVRTRGGSIEEWPLKKAKKAVEDLLRRKVSMYEMVTDMIDRNELDIRMLSEKDIQKVKLDRTVPRVKEFYGRKDEMDYLKARFDDRENRIISVVSIAGGGKTSLLSRFILSLETKKVIWTYCNTYKGTSTFLGEISSSLRTLGAEGLHSYLTSEGRLDIVDASRAMTRDLSRTGTILVIEDLHKAPADLEAFLKCLKETILEGNLDLKMVISSRTRPPIYTRTEVALRKELSELDLEGLTREETSTMLRARSYPLTRLDEVYSMTCGNPLALQLYLMTGSMDWKDARFSLDRFIREEMVSKLTDREWKVVKLASLFRIPVYQKAFAIIEGVDESTIRGLIDKMLLVEYPDGTCFLHELLKDPVRSEITPKEEKKLSHYAFRHFSTVGTDPAIMESIHFARASGREEKARSYILKYGEYLASRGFQRIWDMAKEIDDAVLEGLDLVTKYLIGFESFLLEDDIGGAKEMLNRAKAYCEKGIRKGGGQEWNAALSRVLNRFGELARMEGISEKAIVRYRESLEVLRRNHDDMGEAKALNNLGVAYLDRGDVKAAREFFKDSESILRKLRDQRGLSFVHINMGEIESVLGNEERALSLYEMARIEASEAGSRNLELEALSKLGSSALEAEDDRRAMEAMGECITGYREVGNHRALLECLKKASPAILRSGGKHKTTALLNSLSKSWKRRTGLFQRSSRVEMSADEKQAYFLIHLLRSLLASNVKEAEEELKKYLGWCTIHMSGDRYIEHMTEMDRMLEPAYPRFRDIFYNSALSAATMYREVQPQIILLIRYARKSHPGTAKRRKILKKAIDLSSKGAFPAGEKKARKMLESIPANKK